MGEAGNVGRGRVNWRPLWEAVRDCPVFVSNKCPDPAYYQRRHVHPE